MSNQDFTSIFTPTFTDEIFPAERTNDFFDALFGDPDEGAYTIKLTYQDAKEGKLLFHFELHQRGDQCLRCNLTTGLPAVFERHNIINAGQLAQIIAEKAGYAEHSWNIGSTEQVSDALHLIPFIVEKK